MIENDLERLYKLLQCKTFDEAVSLFDTKSPSKLDAQGILESVRGSQRCLYFIDNPYNTPESIPTFAEYLTTSTRPTQLLPKGTIVETMLPDDVGIMGYINKYSDDMLNHHNSSVTSGYGNAFLVSPIELLLLLQLDPSYTDQNDRLYAKSMATLLYIMPYDEFSIDSHQWFYVKAVFANFVVIGCGYFCQTGTIVL